MWRSRNPPSAVVEGAASVLHRRHHHGGEGVNIGAGSITCNYDGANKHATIIGDGAFIGSDTMMVAPVTIGAGALGAPAPPSPRT